MLKSGVAITVAHRPAPLTLHLVRPEGADPVRTVLFSHGDGLSPADYDPLLGAWAGRGLAIAAPDHAGRALCPLWLTRVLDMHAAARHLATPVRLAGHSYGGHTVAILLGAVPVLVERPGGLALEQADAGLLLTPPGDGDPASLSAEWHERAPYLCLDPAGFLAPTLILAGGRDPSPIIRSGWQWTPSSNQHEGKHIGVAPAGDHYLGGIATGRGAPNTALFAEIAATTADYLLQGPAWMPTPSHHLNFTAHPPKGHHA
jgi:hypothetical protein